MIISGDTHVKCLLIVLTAVVGIILILMLVLATELETSSSIEHLISLIVYKSYI